MPWVEKYRPKLLKDVVGNEETLVRLEAIAEQGNMPNLILSGPPGTGKVRKNHQLARSLVQRVLGLTLGTFVIDFRRRVSMHWQDNFWEALIRLEFWNSMPQMHEELM